MDTDEQDFSSRTRIGLNQRPDRWLDRITLFRRVVGVAQHESRMQGVVNRSERLDLTLAPVGERIPGHTEIGELGVAAGLRGYH